MAEVKLRFVNAQNKYLADLDLSDDILIKKMLPAILQTLRDKLQTPITEPWRLVLRDEAREIDLDETFASAGVKTGSVVILGPGIHKIGRYEILEEIGRGGMGVVYKARHIDLGHIVALKIINAENAKNKELIERFKREARAVAKLSGHPNVVAIHDFAFYEENGSTVPYFVMDYIDGDSLSQLIETRNALPLEETAEILDGVTSALDMAHKNGIIHRDLKPSNVLLVKDPSGRWIPKLADFGLVKTKEAVGNLTQTGVILGSPYYMSPEQALAKPLTEQSDIYSLGVMVYEMLTGKQPFQDRTSPTAIMMAHATEQPPPLTFYQKNLPKPVENVVLKALAKEPGDRYESAGAFAKAFRGAVVGKDVPGPKTPFPWHYVLAGLAIVAVLALAGWFFFLRPPTHTQLLKRAAKATEAKNYTLAEENCNAVLARDAKDIEGVACLNDVAEQYNLAGSPKDAMRLYEQILVQHANGDERATAGLLTFVLSDGQSAMDAKEYVNAEKHFARVLTLDKESPQANLGMGEALFLQDKYEASIPYYQKALNSDVRVQAQTRIGWAYYNSGQYEKAVQTFHGLGYENELEASKGLGLSYFALKWYDDALRPTERWKNLEPAQPEPHLAMGMVYEQLGNVEQAANEYERWAQLLGDDVEANLSAAKMLHKAEQYERAVTLFVKVTKLAPNSIAAWQGLGQSFMALKQNEAALAAYGRVLALDPSNKAILSELGWGYLQIKDYVNAEGAFQKLLDSGNTSANVYQGLGRSLLGQKRYTEAVSMLGEMWKSESGDVSLGLLYSEAQILVDTPDAALITLDEISADAQQNSRYWELMGRAYDKLKDYTQAASAYRQWSSLDPQSPARFVRLGWSLHLGGEPEEAIIAFQHALEIDNTWVDAYMGIGKAAAALGDHKTAKDANAMWVQLRPQDPLAYHNLAWTLLYLKEMDSAIENFKSALNLDSNLAGSHTGIGLAYQQLKQCDLAIPHFKEALRLNPNDTSAESRLKACSP